MTTKPYTYNERDISWLRFNERVLQESIDASVPLYERIKFLAIFSSNLDEFFNVRVSALRQFKKLDKPDRKSYDIRPNRTLKMIYKEVRRQQELFGAVIRTEILPELEEVGCYLRESHQYDDHLRSEVLKYYNEHLSDEIIHVDVSSIEGVPPLVNHKIYLVHRHKNGGVKLTSIPVEVFGRFVTFHKGDEEQYIVFLEDIISTYIKHQFGNELDEIISIKMSRDLETYIEDEFTGDLIEKIKYAIDAREGGRPTRLLYDKNVSSEFLEVLRKRFGLRNNDLIEGGSYHNFSDFFSFPRPKLPHAVDYEPMPPLAHPKLEGASSLLRLIQESDQILHFPYQKFDYIPKILQEAADSPDVRAIKMTLYRISKHSEVAQALLYALSKGKEVVVFIEAKARFDEKNNLTWGEQLEVAGASVIYSYPGIKIHSKIFLIRMNAESEMKDVGYVGTGNFNENTSKIYADHGVLTSESKVTKELNQVFHVLQRKIIVPKNKRLIISPFNTRRFFEDWIDRAIDAKKENRPVQLLIKMNSLEDRGMIDKLYEANAHEIPVRMIVRGFCCLQAGVPGLSEHIHVTSILDRFLEHARIYYFTDGTHDELIIGSADWMTRNLDRRIEVCLPLKDERIKKEILTILNMQVNDNVKSRVIDHEERNEFVFDDNKKKIRAQFNTYKYLKSLN